MNRLDAVASESYLLQSVTPEPQATETKDANQTEAEGASLRTTTTVQLLEKEQPEEALSSDISEKNQTLNELHSEEEDKFSDFDPTALPEEEPQSSLNFTESLPVANIIDDNGEVRPVKEGTQLETDDYMSDVSSGEDFLSATHDHSGPEDGEYSDGDEILTSNQRENKTHGATPDSSAVPDLQQKELPFIPSGPLGNSEAPTEYKEKEPCEKINLPLEKDEKSVLQQSNSQILVDNASPINDEDLDSLEDFDQSDVAINNEKETVYSEIPIKETETQASDLSREERSVGYEGDICNETVTKCEVSDTYDSNLNPEPIDSSPDLLTNCGDDTNEVNTHKLNLDAFQNNPNVEGKLGAGLG